MYVPHVCGGPKRPHHRSRQIILTRNLPTETARTPGTHTTPRPPAPEVVDVLLLLLNTHDNNPPVQQHVCAPNLPHLHDVAPPVVLRTAHIEDEVGTVVARSGIGFVLHYLGTVVVGVDVVVEVMHAFLLVLSLSLTVPLLLLLLLCCCIMYCVSYKQAKQAENRRVERLCVRARACVLCVVCAVDELEKGLLTN